MAYDPWAGYNQGMQNLGNTFTDLDRSRQAKEQHDLEAKRQALLSRALQLQVEDAERQQKMQEGLTQAVNQQPNAQFVPTPREQPMPTLGGISNTGQAPQPFQMPQQQQPSSVFNTPGQIQQQQPNMERAMLDYYKRTDPVKAQEFGKQLITKFKELAGVDPKGAITWYNGVSGMNLTYEGQNGDYIITKTDDGKIIATDKSNPLKSQIVYEGTSRGDMQMDQIIARDELNRRRDAENWNRRDAAQGQRLAAMESRAARAAAGKSTGAGGDGRPLPVAALRIQKEELDAIGTASGINADLAGVEKQLASGKIKLGPVENVESKGLNLAGMSTESSRNFATFQSTLEKLRNDSLRLNKGVQTEGDAQRAWNEIMNNVNDKKLVQQRLKEVQRINQRAVDLRRNNINVIRANYGQEPLDTEKFEKVPGAIGGGDKGNAGKKLDATTAQKFLRQAGGNKDKAREMARKAGFSF